MSSEMRLFLVLHMRMRVVLFRLIRDGRGRSFIHNAFLVFIQCFNCIISLISLGRIERDCFKLAVEALWINCHIRRRLEFYFCIFVIIALPIHQVFQYFSTQLCSFVRNCFCFSSCSFPSRRSGTHNQVDYSVLNGFPDKHWNYFSFPLLFRIHWFRFANTLHCSSYGELQRYFSHLKQTQNERMN